jgi:hypothetical protein
MGRIHGSLLALFACIAIAAFTQTPGQQVADRASDFLGVREVGGNNRGPAVEAILAAADQKPGQPWCGAFSLVVHKAAGIYMPGNPARYAWSPTWFHSSKVVWRRGDLVESVVHVGDQIGLYYPKIKRIGHVGTIVAIEGRWLVTIEGNTNGMGSRDGSGVHKQRRRIDSIYVISRWW